MPLGRNDESLTARRQREAERQGANGAGSGDWSRVLDSSGDADMSINDIEMDVS